MPMPGHDQTDYQALFRSLPGLYLVLTPELRIADASDAYLTATMTDRDRIRGQYLFDVFPDNPRDTNATGVSNLSASLQRVLATRKPDAMAVQKYDVQRPADAGGGFEERHWSPLNTPVLDERGAVRWIVHRVEDITEFVRMREQQVRGDAAVAGLNVRAQAMESEILQRSRQLELANRELRALHGQLEERVAERTAALARANDNLQQEISARHSAAAELAQAEKKLLHAQRMEAIGHLAGGVAHDFNNILTVILGAEEMLRSVVNDLPAAHGDLDLLRDAANRASDLTRQLLAFSRQQIRQVTVLDLGEVVRGVQPILARVIGESIRFDVVGCDRECAVAADRAQLEQVLLNLVVNARDAMPTGGRLTVTWQPMALDGAAASAFDVLPGQYVALSVADTGIGMDEATRARIFEPFFSTKQPGKGTGLGLSTVYGIVKQSHGGLRVDSEPGRGTTFLVCLPVSTATPDVGAVALPSRDLRARPGERILLVEDDDAVREMTARILAESGYEAIPADGPDQALAIARDPDVSFCAVVTDAVMLVMGGLQLAGLLTRIRPGLRVLFMSGYTDDQVLQQGILPSGSTFLQKPVTGLALTAKLRELLDRPVSTASDLGDAS